MNKSKNQVIKNQDSGQRRLMISGVLALDNSGGACAVVERGMSILSQEGQRVGKVAAVSVNQDEAVEAILLSRLPLRMEYHVVPAESISAVRNHEVVLDLTADAIDSLEEWSTG